ncbi:MAG: acyl-CoA dehydrogenase family protein [Deltaproteobacteria bacterium]|nr:acyl-CoA dehydrogenase family protein [Deltaproteobacteria bacterium]
MNGRTLAFLSNDTCPGDLFSPEDLDGEQKLLSGIVDDFVKGEVQPRMEELEHKTPDVLEKVLAQAADLGLLGIDVPEAFGGMGLDHVSSLVITERILRGGPFGLTQVVHTAFGTIPVLYFGDEAQKRRWLPDLATGRKIGAYALTESDAGSDARQIGSQASLSGDEASYVLNGEKQFTSNSGIANVFTVFAKIDGERFSAFLVDGGSKGISLNEEEKKMGIRGSSTRGILFDNVVVPREEVVLSPGAGQSVAFNTLSIGRHRLAGACLGIAKQAFEESVRYSKTRRQFGRPISAFGMVRQKIAEMAVRVFVAEGVLYRTAHVLDGAIAGLDLSSSVGFEAAERIKRCAADCAIDKVYASEMLKVVADEALQIHGGYGYIEDYPIERYYRDARIYRIFGGTNEINRLLIAKTMLAGAATSKGGRSPNVGTAADDSGGSGVLAEQANLVERTKAMARSLLDAVRDISSGIEQQSEVMGLLADILIETYAMETCLLRAQKTHERWGAPKSDIPALLTAAYIDESTAHVERWAQIVAAAAHGSSTAGLAKEGIERLRNRPRIDMLASHRQIAEFFLDTGRYFIC